MPYIARKTFMGDGTRYRPGDIVPDAFLKWPRPESLVRTGYVHFVEKSEPVEVKPEPKASKKDAPVVVETIEVVEEAAEVVEEVIETEE